MKETKCEICGEKTSTVHVQQVMGNEIIELNLCDACAQKKGISSNDDKIELSLSQLLTGLIDLKADAGEEKSSESCPRCGQKLSEFRKEGRLGCAECYVAFKREIELFLENTVGTNRHRGKYPRRLLAYKSLLTDRERLQGKLKEAITREDYEEAAELRDEIRTIERTAGEHHD